MNETTMMNPENALVYKKRGITGSTLKLIAIITMLIDHTGATILEKTLATKGFNSVTSTDPQAVMELFADNILLIGGDFIMRMIGRIAFPIFCFLLVEGFLHTRNMWKYAGRLAIFALLSEIPFDLAFNNKLFYFEYQNVFFTLLIGLLVLIGFKTMKEKAEGKSWLPILGVLGGIAIGCMVAYKSSGIVYTFNTVLSTIGSSKTIPIRSAFIAAAIVLSIIALIVYIVMCKVKSLQVASLRFADLLILAIGMGMAEFLITDYSGFGVLTIAVVYGFRKSHFKAMLGGCVTLIIMSISELPCIIDIVLAKFYNGERGINLKYVFYAFYPVHLLILYFICYAMNIV